MIDGLRSTAIFVILVSTLMSGATAVLYILHLMEHISPLYCLTALAVFIFTAVMTMVVMINEG
jgi:hypothetical protein